MRTITKEVRVYNYGELDSDAKHEAKKRIFYKEDAKAFTASILEDLENKWDIVGLRPYYNLEYGYNKGLCLLGHIYFGNIGKKLKDIFFQGFEVSDYKEVKKLAGHSLIEFKNCGDCYNSSAININVYTNGCQDRIMNCARDKTLNKLTKNIEEWYCMLCHKYESKLYEMFYESDEEEFLQYLRVKNYQFLENGTIIE